MKMIAKNTKKILIYLLRNLELVNINQISKRLGISVGSAFKILKGLEERGIVLPLNLGNAKFYKLNLENEETTRLCEFLLIEERKLARGYIKLYLDEIKKFKNAELIILFGSILENKDFNDVDVLFVANKPKEVTKFCLELSRIRTKPVVPLILEKKDLIKEIKNKKEVILNILKTGVILKGESVFLEVVKHARQ